MKRTAKALVLLAGLGGGGCATDQQSARAPQQPMPANQMAAAQTPAGGFGTVTRGKQVGNVQGPMGEPVMAVRGAMPAGMSGGVKQAGAMTLVGEGSMIRPVAGGGGPAHITSNDGCTNCNVPGVGGAVMNANYGPPPGAFAGAPGYGGTGPYGPQPPLPKYGITPVPTMGPPGAVAAVGAYTGGMSRPPMINGRSSINFTGPAGMKVTWQLPDGSFNDEANALTAPKEYNFLQGQVYRLRLTSILPDHPGRSFYPTLEVAPGNPKSLTFLSHSSVPITFSPDDFAQARAGNLVVKVIYLPDPINQDFSTVVGAEEVVSTRLEPGADPVAEAQRRGTVLAVIRMGNIDLENRVSPAMTAPPPGLIPLPPPGVVPPGFVPGGPVPGGPKMVPPKDPKGGKVGSDVPSGPPGVASVNPPAALPSLPVAPTDLPPIPANPLAPVAPPAKAPAPKAK